MKVAVIMTGAVRSFSKCLPNLEWHVFRHFPGAKFYCVAPIDGDEGELSRLRDKHTDVSIKCVVQPEMVMPAGCPAQWTPGQPYMHEPYAISVPPSAVMGQLWMLREGWRLYEEGGEQADLVIRIRPDLWFHSFELPHGIRVTVKDEARQILGTMDIQNPTTAWTPRWGRFGGSNDRFALLGSGAAQAYFTAYDNIPDMIKEGAPLHPETLVDYAMTRKGITVNRNMKADFSTRRTEEWVAKMRAQGRDEPIMRPPEVTGSDLLDAAHA